MNKVILYKKDLNDSKCMKRKEMEWNKFISFLKGKCKPIIDIRKCYATIDLTKEEINFQFIKGKFIYSITLNETQLNNLINNQIYFKTNTDTILINFIIYLEETMQYIEYYYYDKILNNQLTDNNEENKIISNGIKLLNLFKQIIKNKNEEKIKN